MQGDYLTVGEISAHLRVSTETVRRWLRAGKLAGVWLSDAAGWRVTRSELERFIQERSHGAGQTRVE